MLKNDEGMWVEGVDKLQAMINEFYKELFSEKYLIQNWCQTEVTFPEMDGDMKERLVVPYSNDEVKKVIFNLKP